MSTSVFGNLVTCPHALVLKHIEFCDYDVSSRSFVHVATHLFMSFSHFLLDLTFLAICLSFLIPLSKSHKDKM